MNLPHPDLMRAYGTTDVFLQKTADAMPLLARLGAAALNYEMAASQNRAMAEQKAEDDARYEAKREYELERARQMTPMMTRLASVAAAAGADAARMAKEAGVGDFATGVVKGLGTFGKNLKAGGLKKNLLLGGAGLATLYGGSKVINKTTRAMQKGPEGPATFGGQYRGVGYQPAAGVNEYGYPQN